MAKVIAYEYRANGIRKTITSQNDLTKAIKQTNKELVDGAKFGTKEYEELTKQQAELKNSQQEVRREAKITQRALVVAADQGRGSVRGLTAELKNAEEAWRDLSREERRSQVGQELAANIRGIREEIRETNAEIGKPGLRGALTEVFGNLGGFDLASFTSIAGAATAVAAAGAEAIQFVGELTERFRELRGQVSLLVDGTEEELDSFTSQIAAIGDTFGENEQDILNAANTVAQQLDIPFQEALDRIEEGFIAGSNQNGEFLDSLREYPAFFKEAELGADALFQVVNQQATEGIYSDKGVDAIKEATLRIREMPKATAAAFDAIGLDSQKIQQQIEDEGIGAAIATVSTRLGELEADSPAVGQALADIFGGAGEDAGLDFILSLQTINEETGSLIDTSNAYQAQQLRTLEVNKEFATVQNEVAKRLGDTEQFAANLGTQIRTQLLRLLIFTIDRFNAWWEAMLPIREAISGLLQQLGLFNEEGQRTERLMNIINAVLAAQEFVWNLLGKAVGFAIEQVTKFIGKVVNVLEFLGILDENAGKAAASVEELADQQRDAGQASAEQEQKTGQAAGALDKYRKSTTDTTAELKKYTDATNLAAVATDQFATGSIAALRDQVSKLQEEIEKAAPEDQEGLLTKLLGAEEALQEAEDYQQRLRAAIADRNRTINLEQLRDRENLLIDETALEEDYAAEQIEINRKKNEQMLLDEQIRMRQVQEIQEGLFSSLNSAIEVLTTTSEARTESEIRDLEKRYNQEIEQAEGNTEKQEQLALELANKREQIRKEEFERQKEYQIAAAFISLAQGIINTLAAPSTIPDPFGSVFKAIRIGILTATAAAQISAISSQQAAEGWIQKLGSGELVNGVFRGSTHSDPGGGIPIQVGNTRLLVEHGEAMDQDEFGAVAIINKRSSARYRNLLDAIRGRSFAGKRQVLSHINSSGGAGVRFAQQGAILQPDILSLAATTSSQAALNGGRVTAVLTEESVTQIASTTAAAVKEAAIEGIIIGTDGANRQAERQDRLNQRTGITS